MLLERDVFFEVTSRDECFRTTTATNLSCIIKTYPADRLVTIIWDHTCLDGLGYYNHFMTKLLGFRKLQDSLIMKDKYRPFISEIAMLPLIGRLILQGVNYQKLSTFKNIKQQKVLSHTYTARNINAIKKRFDCSLNELILSIYIRTVFNAMLCKKTISLLLWLFHLYNQDLKIIIA